MWIPRERSPTLANVTPLEERAPRPPALGRWCRLLSYLKTRNNQGRVCSIRLLLCSGRPRCLPTSHPPSICARHLAHAPASGPPPVWALLEVLPQGQRSPQCDYGTLPAIETLGRSLRDPHWHRAAVGGLAWELYSWKSPTRTFSVFYFFPSGHLWVVC